LAVPVSVFRLPAPARLRGLMLGGLLVFVLAFAAFALAHMFPAAPYGLADDWRVFYAASHVVQSGGNPYDTTTIHAAEQAAQHYPVVQQSLDDFTNLPIVAILLSAVTWLPYWLSFAVFTALGAACAGLALRAWMASAGWNKPGLWLTGAMFSWLMLLGFFAGQFDALLLGATIGALLLMQRDAPVLAGLCMAAVILKPHVLWPVPLLIFAVWLPDRRRAVRFAVTTLTVVIGGTVAGFLLVPEARAFIGHIAGFAGRISSSQPDLAGIPGWLEHLPQGVLLGYVVAVLGAGAIVALAWLAARSHVVRNVTAQQRGLIPLAGLAIWLACTPYAHPNDEILLFPLLVLLVGAQARLLDGRWLQLAAIGCLALIAAFLASPALGVATLGLLVLWGLLERERLAGGWLAACAVVAAAVLPAVWPFHVLDVSLTPVAVTLIALAGVAELRALFRTTQPAQRSAAMRRVQAVR
jgi:hypothetical protein